MKIGSSTTKLKRTAKPGVRPKARERTVLRTRKVASMAVRQHRVVEKKSPRYAATKQAPDVTPSERVSGSAAAFIPARPTIEKLRTAVHACRGCPLYLSGSQAVFGDGPRTARV